MQRLVAATERIFAEVSDPRVKALQKLLIGRSLPIVVEAVRVETHDELKRDLETLRSTISSGGGFDSLAGYYFLAGVAVGLGLITHDDINKIDKDCGDD